MPASLSELNRLDRAAFVEAVGPVFEDSPWIAERTWEERPFASREALHAALCRTVESASADEQVALIRAHPDLVGRAARAGTLTPASTREQAGAGLDALSADEAARFDRYNEAYRARFGFPFVICARENRKESILAAFPVRLAHTRDEEVTAALREIARIARLRLADAVAGDGPDAPPPYPLPL
jgi:2-oxo-4-hydroxy-4-carboxy-5-ureidoimidazoline decarboxylase